uniref:Putative secreted protein n=1 Tax=Anopheles darlingi TaxID=43151 RepID=A0A2M4DQW0_ANODA
MAIDVVAIALVILKKLANTHIGNQRVHPAINNVQAYHLIALPIVHAHRVLFPCQFAHVDAAIEDLFVDQNAANKVIA